MRLKFETRQIREHDSNGDLIAAGFEWTEQRVFLLRLATWLGVPSFFAFVIGLLSKGTAWAPYVVVIGFLGFVGCIAMARLFSYRKAIVVFERGGSISTPNGFVGYRHLKEVIGTHHPIKSIEAVAAKRDAFSAGRYDVDLFSTTGNVVGFAQDLDQFAAHKVAVQLMTALQEIRDAEAQALQPKPMEDAPVRRVID